MWIITFFGLKLGQDLKNRAAQSDNENDFRPISLTSPIAKVLEGFSAESLITSVFNKLENKQFTLPDRSTTQALIFMHTILEALDSCGRSDHNVLLSELK